LLQITTVLVPYVFELSSNGFVVWNALNRAYAVYFWDGERFMPMWTMSHGWASLAYINLSEGEHRMLVRSLNPFWFYHDNERIFAHSSGIWEFEIEDSVSAPNYIFSVQGISLDWDGDVTAYFIDVNRHDGEGFVRLPFSSGGSSIPFTLFNLTEGNNTVRVSRVAPSGNDSNLWLYSNGVVTRHLTSNGVGYWEVYFEENNITPDYAFEVDGARFHFNGSSTHYRMYVDRDDGENFVFLMNVFGGNEVHLSSLLLTGGNNTVRVVPNSFPTGAFSYYDGVLTLTTTLQRVAYWEIYFEEVETFRDYDIELIGANFRWNGLIATYRVYVDRHDDEGFQFIGLTAGGHQRPLSTLDLTKGQNTIKIHLLGIPSLTWSYENGVLTRATPTNSFHWEIYFEENILSTTRVFQSFGTYFDFNRVAPEYRIYVDRHNNSGFQFIGNSLNGIWVRMFTNLNLTLGPNTIRVVPVSHAANQWNYQNGILSLTIPNTGYWEFEKVEYLDTVSWNYDFEVRGSAFLWNGSNYMYDVYVDRDDGLGFVSVFSIWGGNTLTLLTLRLTVGSNTVRVVSRTPVITNIWQYENGVLTRVSTQTGTGYWEIELEEVAPTENYDFEVTSGQVMFRFNGLSASYRVYVDRHDGNGFIFIASHWGTSSMWLDSLGLTAGSNTIRVSRSGSAQVSWSYVDGVLTRTLSIGAGYWEVYFTQNNLAANFAFEIINGGSLRWGGTDANYQLLVNRHDGEGFVLIFSGNGTWGTHLANLRLNEGRNSVRVVRDIFIYGNGNLVQTRTTGYWEIDDFREEERTNDYNFRLSGSTHFWWGGLSGSSYRVYVDRDDNEGFQFIGTTWGNSSRTLESLNLTLEGNTIRIVGNIYSYVNGVITRLVSVGFWSVEVVDTTATANYEFSTTGASFRFNGTSASYRVYVDRHDNLGFQFVGTATGTSTMPFAFMGLTFGQNTIRVSTPQSTHFWSYLDGVLTRTFVTGNAYWDFYYNETTVSVTYNFQFDANSMRWNNRVGHYRLYVNRYDNLGFVFLTSFTSTFTNNMSITYQSLRFTLGWNAVRVVGEYWTIADGVLTRTLSLGERRIYLQETVETNEYDFWLVNDNMRWNGRSSINYRVYVDRHDNLGFQFIGTTSGTGQRALSTLGLTQGNNTVRITSVGQTRLSYSNGVLSLIAGSHAYWNFQYIHDDRVELYNFELTGSSFRFHGSNVSYRVYVDRDDNEGFQFIGYQTGIQTRQLSMLGLNQGNNTIRVVSTVVPPHLWEYNDGVLTRFLSQGTGYWEIYFEEQNVVGNYVFEVAGILLRVHGATPHGYILEVKQPGSDSFVPMMTFSTTVSLMNLDLMPGEHIFRITSFAIWTYENGTMRMTVSTGYWKFELVEQDFTRDYDFPITGQSFSIHGPWSSLLYRMYVDRHDGNGFVFVRNVTLSAATRFADLGLTSGQNTIRVISQIANPRLHSMYYSNGILFRGQSSSYFDIYLEEGSISRYNYVFEMMSNNFSFHWNGIVNSEYRVYVDRHDNIGFQFIGITFGGATRGIATLGLTLGENTIRIVGRTFTYYDGVIIFTTTYDYWEIYLENDEAIDFGYVFSRNSGAGFRIDGRSGVNYRVYVDRHDGHGFVFIGYQAGTATRMLVTLGLTNGENTVRMISIAPTFWTYYDGILTQRHTFGYWQVYVETINTNYNFEVTGANFRWHGLNSGYSVCVDRQNDEGFVTLTTTTNGTAARAISTLNLTQGNNIVRVAAVSLWTDANGVTYLRFSQGLWTFYFDANPLENNGIRTVDYNLVFQNSAFRIANGASVRYDVYRDRHDGDGFEFVWHLPTATGYSLLMHPSGFSQGLNTIKVVSSVPTFFEYVNGVLKGFRTTAYRVFYFSYEEVDYDFTLTEDGISWDGLNIQYRVVIDRHDGEDFVNILGGGTVGGNIMTFERLELTRGYNTIMVYSVTSSTNNDGIAEIHFTIGLLILYVCEDGYITLVGN